MLNHVVLMGEIIETNKNGVILHIDENTNIQINLSDRFQELLNEFYEDNILMAIRGKLVINDKNTIVVEADKIQFHNIDKEQIITKSQNDISR